METILVVDDDEAVRKTIAFGLEKNRFRVLEAGTDWEAMISVQDDHLGLILCDLNLGRGAGNAAAAALRRKAASRGIPFVLMTGEPQLDGDGAVVLKKPFTMPELLRVIKSQLKKRSARGADEGHSKDRKPQQVVPKKTREAAPDARETPPSQPITPKVSREQLEAVLSRVQRLREEERTEVARAIHDDLTQTLTVLALELSFLESGLSSASGKVPPEEYLPAVKHLSDLVNALIRSAQEITARLRPKVLDEFGFTAALEWLCGQVEQKTGVPCELGVQGTELRWNSAVSGELYRLSEDILGYLARRSSKISIQVANRGGNLNVEFKSHATKSGPDPAEESGSLELLAMSGTAERLGGGLNFVRQPGRGIIVSVAIPSRSNLQVC